MNLKIIIISLKIHVQYITQLQITSVINEIAAKLINLSAQLIPAQLLEDVLLHTGNNEYVLYSKEFIHRVYKLNKNIKYRED